MKTPHVHLICFILCTSLIFYAVNGVQLQRVKANFLNQKSQSEQQHFNLAKDSSNQETFESIKTRILVRDNQYTIIGDSQGLCFPLPPPCPQCPYCYF